MNTITPEAAGISSRCIKSYIEELENAGLATHNLLLMRGKDLFFESYRKPFSADFLHRQYSVSKSFVSIAIGFLEQDGKIDLNDPIEKYFAKELANQPDMNMHRQTIRHMLMMSTSKLERNWFMAKPSDRVQFYFDNDRDDSRPSGTVFQYDSTGSFILGVLVERISGKPFMEYLNEKLFCKIGVSSDSYCLKCPGGHSWGDSAILMRPRDVMRVARFMLNGGEWNGEQILNRDYVISATSKQISNDFKGNNTFDNQGYGYLIWKTYNDSFFFNGMGCQFAVCVPKKDLIMVYNGDNQGNPLASSIIIDGFFKHIAENTYDALPENEIAYKELKDYADSLSLFTLKGKAHVPFANEISGKTYYLDENPMGITRFTLDFESNTFSYTNAQGDKEIKFGMCENVYGLFPQEGYAKEVGTVETKGHFYKCAASAAWIEDKKIQIKVQIIDTYFGNMSITIGFFDDRCGVYMEKTAEDFLKEYMGYAQGERK